MSLVIIISFIYLLIAAILFHEIGHLIIMRSYGVKGKLKPYYKSIRRFGIKTGNIKHFNNKQIRTIAAGGILFGFFPLLLFGLLDNNIYLLTIPPYIMGCLKDVDIILNTYGVKV